MKHVRFITIPLKASMLQDTQQVALFAQKIAIFGTVAAAVNTLAGAFNTYTQGTERKGSA